MSAAVPSLTLAEAQRIVQDAGFTLRVAETEGGCWDWLGSRDRCGYGRAGWWGGNRLVHRVTFSLLVGPIADGLTIDHLCRNRACCNPAHLQAVSLRENIARGDGVGVRNAAKTHCKHGHEFTPENIYWKRGKRACRICGRERNRQQREKKRAT